MAYYDDMCEVWELVRESFHDKLSSETINLWFGTLRIVSFKGRELTMSIKSPFKYDIIKEKYLGEIKARFSKMLGFDIDIVLLLEDRDDELIAQSEKPAEEKTVGALGSTMPPYNFEYTFDNFIVGNSNKFAHAAATAVAAAPAMNYNPLFIYGPSGLGKTHLLYAITNEVKKKKRDAEIIYIKGEDFTNQLIEALARQKTAEFRNKYRSCDMLLIDDIQFIAGKEQTEEKFFHIFNELYKLNKAIVLTSDRPAKEIKSISDRLKTRFSSGLAADVRAPEYETRLAIIQRKADLLNFKIPDDVVDFIATKLKSNIRQIEGVVTKMNALYMVSQIKPTIVVAQNVIKDIVSDHQPIPITVDKIISEAAKIYNVDPDEIRSPKRNSPVSSARKVAIYVIQEITGLPYETIGQEFSGRDHSTVVYAIKNVKEMMAKDSNFRSVIEDLIKNIKANQ